MFDRFTDRSRRVVVMSHEAARGLKHDFVGTEHLLLGLLSEENGVAARVLESLDITAKKVREQVVKSVPSGEEASRELIPFSPQGKTALEQAYRESLSLGHNYVGTEHILLGLVREDEGLAALILRGFGADAETIADEVIRLLSDGLDSEVAKPGEIPFTPRAKKVLELALREALSLGHNYIGTEHILLGLAIESEGVASKILLGFDVDPQRIRSETIRMHPPVNSSGKSDQMAASEDALTGS